MSLSTAPHSTAMSLSQHHIALGRASHRITQHWDVMTQHTNSTT
jgi:hypothetical protein